MTSADPSGCRASSSARSASAGGQLEQPSEVKSSTITGSRGAAAGLLWVGTPELALNPQTKNAARNTEPTAAIHLMRLIRTSSNHQLNQMPEKATGNLGCVKYRVTALNRLVIFNRLLETRVAKSFLTGLLRRTHARLFSTHRTHRR